MSKFCWKARASFPSTVGRAETLLLTPLKAVVILAAFAKGFWHSVVKQGSGSEPCKEKEVQVGFVTLTGRTGRV